MSGDKNNSKQIEFLRSIFLSETVSTNEYALHLSNSAPNPNTCLYTFSQTGGRGQIGRKWYSGTDKNLSTTFLWHHPPLLPQRQWLINMAFALAVHEMAQAQLPDTKVKLKWPNDLYVEKQKLAGILIQNTLVGKRLEATYLGVGFNVNERDFPPDLPNPTSLSLLTGRHYELLDLQWALTTAVSNQLSNLVATLDDPESLYTRYLDLLYLKDQIGVYEVDGQKVSGIIRGVTPEGKLRLELEEGERAFGFRELGYVRG